MKQLRKQIDRVDANILELLAKRKVLAQKIKRYKREHGLPIVIPEREAEVYKTRAAWGRKNGLNPKSVNRLMKIIITESRRVQN
jgi:chorismate mutase